MVNIIGKNYTEYLSFSPLKFDLGSFIWYFSYGPQNFARCMSIFKLFTKKSRKPLFQSGTIYSTKKSTTVTKFPKFKKTFGPFMTELKHFFRELSKYIFRVVGGSFLKFEAGKTGFASALYRQRGKNARRFVHTGMATLAAFGVMIAPVVAKEYPGSSLDPWTIESASPVLSATSSDPTIKTDISTKPRDKILEYQVQEGDTISSIADKFNISTDTVLWQNSLNDKSKIKPGQTLQILPVTGISHKVQKGDTIYSIAKKYDSSPQAIVDFDFNTFVNDETFELAIGQTIIVPDGVKPTEKAVTPRTLQSTPNAGTVVAAGIFVWPTNGTITQRFSWYHPGIDVANKATPDILAADAGVITIMPYMGGGYGNYIIIDHGNGYKTLYGHMSRFYVGNGQTVNRGDRIGKMGSTGRSTGTHLHFEVSKNGVKLNPLSFLR